MYQALRVMRNKGWGLRAERGLYQAALTACFCEGDDEMGRGLRYVGSSFLLPPCLPPPLPPFVFTCSSCPPLFPPARLFLSSIPLSFPLPSAERKPSDYTAWRSGGRKRWWNALSSGGHPSTEGEQGERGERMGQRKGWREDDEDG